MTNVAGSSGVRPNSATFLLYLHCRSKLDQRSPPRLFDGHAELHIHSDLHLNMKIQFFP
jgi:hypothetical protein